MRDYFEMQFMSQMLGNRLGDGQTWLMIAYLAGLFVVLLWRPDTLRHPSLFRWSCTLFALSILAPPVFNVAITMFMGDNLFGSGGRGAVQFMQLASSSGPVLFGASMILGFASLAPSPVRQPVGSQEQQGPFD